MSAATSSLKQQFDRDGYAIYENVIDADLVREASDHVDWLLQKNPDLRPEQLHNNLMTDDPFWVRLVGDERLLDIAQQYVGPDIALFASHYISKPPGDGQPVLWHQDGSYWPLDPMEVVTLWLAVDDSLPENGCLDPELVEEDRAVDIVVPAGGVSVHHPNIVHGSNANTSDRRRCGLTIRYIPTTTRIVSDGPWPSAFLLRGEAVEGVNEYLPKPRYREDAHMAFRGCKGWI